MSQVLIASATTGNNTAVNSGLTRYSAICNNMTIDSTESRHNMPIRIGGVFSNYSVKVTANTLNSGTHRFRYRVGGVNGNSLVSFTTNTGLVEDASNTDTATAGDIINTSLVTEGTSGSLTVAFQTFLFAATSNTGQIIASVSTTLATYALNNTVNYVGLAGAFTMSATEADHQFKFRTGGTLSNSFVVVTTNSRTTDTLIRSRIGGVNGNLLITVTTGQTGIREDTSNTDTISTTNLVNFSIIGGAEATNFIMGAMGAHFTTTDGTWVSPGTGTLSLNFNTRYQTFYGYPTSVSVESQTQAVANHAFTASMMGLYISSNACTVTSNYRFRKNTANGNQAVAVLTTVTGYVEDTSNTDAIVDGDLFCFQWDTGNSGAVVHKTFGFLATNPAAAAATFIPKVIFIN